MMVVKKFNTAAVCHIWFVRTTQRRPIHGALYKFRHYRLIVTYLRILFFCHGLKVLFMGPKFHFGVWLLNVRIHRSDHPIAAPCAKWRIWALVDGWKLGKNVKIEELWRPLAPKPYTSYKKLIGSPQVLDYNVEWTVSFEGTSIRMSWPNLVKIRCWEQSKLIDLVGLYTIQKPAWLVRTANFLSLGRSRPKFPERRPPWPVYQIWPGSVGVCRSRSYSRKIDFSTSKVITMYRLLYSNSKPAKCHCRTGLMPVRCTRAGPYCHVDPSR